MKKFLLMIVVAFAFLTANAQFYVGGTLNLWHDDNADATEFTLAPSVGYELNKKWAIGGELEFSAVSDYYTKFAIAPYARWSFFQKDRVKLFLDMGFGISVFDLDDDWDDVPGVDDSETGFQIGVQPGIAVALTKHFSVLAKVGFFGYDDSYTNLKSEGFGLKLSGENLRFGIEYKF